MRWAGPVLASDRLILTGTNGEMISVSPYKGNILSRVAIGGTAYQPPVVAGGTVFVLTDDGKLSAYR